MVPSRPPAACPEAMLDLPSSHAAGVSGPITEAACGSGGSGGVLSRAPKARSRSHVFAATMRPSRNEPRAGRAQPRILAEGRPGYRDVSTLVLRPEPRGSGPIPRLFISSDLLSGAKRLCGARLGRDSWQGQTEARCTMRFPISSKPGHSIPQWRQPKKKKGKLRRQASILRRRGNYAEVEGCCCSALRTCLSRPDTECNLMTEQPGASRKKSERRSAPLSTP